MRDKLTERIAAISVATTQPDGQQIRAIEVAAVARLAEELQVHRRTVEIAALQGGILPLRYARNLNAYSLEDQLNLLEAHVAVIGLGGLGGAVSIALARVGIGRLTLVDGDHFCDHNLNRQALCTEADLGISKAAVAARQIEAINGATVVTAHDRFINGENAQNLIGEAQVVVDCLDNIPGRFTLQAAAKACDIPLVSAAVGGEAGHLTVILPGDLGLEQIYGPAQARTTDKGAETTLGCLPHIVTVMANLEVAEALKLLLGRGSSLGGRMLLVDLANGLFETVELNT
jgi:molybdopterin/thiamine biosynthesis adenylyltransferase